MKKTILAIVLVAGLTSFAGISKGSTVYKYTESGGNISGTLNGTNFSNASWSIMAEADPSNATYYPAGQNIWTPCYAITNFSYQPFITIKSGSNILTATLINFDIESRNYYFNTSPNEKAAIMFADVSSGVEQGSAAYLTGNSSNFNNLGVIGTFLGISDFDKTTFHTSAGDLIITSDSGVAGTFQVSTAVPEPSTYALFGLGALALVVAYRRKVA